MEDVVKGHRELLFRWLQRTCCFCQVGFVDLGSLVFLLSGLWAVRDDGEFLVLEILRVD